MDRPRGTLARDPLSVRRVFDLGFEEPKARLPLEYGVCAKVGRRVTADGRDGPALRLGAETNGCLQAKLLSALVP